MECNLCNGTGKQLVCGIEISCGCQVKQSLSETKTEPTRVSLYTRPQNVAPFNIAQIEGIIKQNCIALKRTVNFNLFKERATYLLHLSSRGLMIGGSMLFCTPQGFGMENLAYDVLDNYLKQGKNVGGYVSILDLYDTKRADVDKWERYLESEILIVDFNPNTMSSFTSMSRILFSLLDKRKEIGLPTIVFSMYNMKGLISLCGEDEALKERWRGRTNYNILDSLATMETFDIQLLEL